MNEQRRRCARCAHYVRHPQQLGVGQCIQSPPAVIVTQAGMAGVFPPVAADQFCAQWQEHPQAQDVEDAQEVRQVNGRVFTG